MALVENNSKLLITDYKKSLLYLVGLNESLFKSFNPNKYLKRPTGICVLEGDSKHERIFIGDENPAVGQHNNIYVFSSNFEYKLILDDKRLTFPNNMRIDNEFDKSRLYVSDWQNNKITIWKTNVGEYISTIAIQTPFQINFTETSLFVASPVFEHKVNENNELIKIIVGGNCIFEVDKKSHEIKRRITGKWYSPELLNIEPNGNIHILACYFDYNIIRHEMHYLLTLDNNGNIIKKVETPQINSINDAILVNKLLFIIRNHDLLVLECE